jgi:hypothetical protein
MLADNLLSCYLLIVGKSLEHVKTKDVYAEYGCDANTQAFTGHAMALHVSQNDIHTTEACVNN